MLFNSFEFLLFFPLVFFIYWFVVNRNLHVRNLFLIAASYVFYGWWDWRFLSLIVLSSFTDYLTALYIHKSEGHHRKYWLWLSLGVNLGLLGFFKYYNFFVDSFIEAFSIFGLELNPRTLNIILPVGISFYTFQTLSYSLDVYYKKLKPTHDILSFFAFVSFFPQLVAGPIERASKFLPQFYTKKKFCFSDAKDGLQQILWGFFKKIVIADNAAYFVERTFDNYENLPPVLLWIGIVFFAFQIYGDFSGYSDIAIGTAKLLGFNLMRNFNFPYFSKDFSEFWRRWHISLSTWLRDYLFLPVSYRVMGKIKQARFWGVKAEVWGYSIGVLVTWFLGGLWHGANWTFIMWGAVHGLYLIVAHLSRKTRKRSLRRMGIKASNPVLVFVQMVGVFILVNVAWVFFRAENVAQAFGFLSGMFVGNYLHIPVLGSKLLLNIAVLCVFVVAEWLGRNKAHVLKFDNTPLLIRWGIYMAVIYAIIFLGNFKQVEFIYFQF